MIEQLIHLAEPGAWAERSSDYRPAAFDDDGFIHLCTPEQLAGVIDRYYADRDDLLRVVVRVDRLEAPLVWEDTTGSGMRFPHLYGPLNLSAVLAVAPLADHEGGRPGGRRS